MPTEAVRSKTEVRRIAPTAARVSALGRKLGWAALAIGIGLTSTVAQAQRAGGISIARDAETEALVQDYARPLFKAAGIPAGSIQILLVPNPAFNAFVADSSRMFINTGAIVDAGTPSEIIGVLAHETAHLAHGDLAGMRQAIEDAKTAAMLAALVGLVGAVAGSVGGLDGAGQAGTGLAMGGMQVAQRSVLSYQRTQEAAADRSAVDYLNASGQSAMGMVVTMRRLADQMLVSARNINPYVQSHPLPADRVMTLENLARKGKFAGKTDPPELQRRHDLVRAKLVAFTTPNQIGRRYPLSDTSLPARYARAINAYRTGTLPNAIKQIDGLIQADPGNAFFWELKGQALLEGGKPAEAVAPLRKSVSLAPKSGLLRIMLGQALVATGNPANVDEAVKQLNVGLQSDPDVSIGFRTLARAYAIQKNIPMAELATAQGLFADGNVKDAKLHATRAQAKLKNGTPAWLRADDIVSYKVPKLR